MDTSDSGREDVSCGNDSEEIRATRGEVGLRICDCENEVIEDNPSLLLVLVSHDEMTVQANDGMHGMSWAVKTLEYGKMMVG